jgi:hypothetical protein
VKREQPLGGFRMWRLVKSQPPARIPLSTCHCLEEGPGDRERVKRTSAERSALWQGTTQLCRSAKKRPGDKIALLHLAFNSASPDWVIAVAKRCWLPLFLELLFPSVREAPSAARVGTVRRAR